MGWGLIIGFLTLILAVAYAKRTRPINQMPALNYRVTAQNRLEIRLAHRLETNRGTWDRDAIIGFILPAKPLEGSCWRKIYCDLCDPGTALHETPMTLETAKIIHQAHIDSHRAKVTSR